MRIALISALALLRACASADQNLPGIPPEKWVVTFYDRNGFGIVDFELHDLPGAADVAWALSDTKFTGRYDVRLKFGFVFERQHVDLPVPHSVKITPGQPKVFATQ